MLDQSIVLAFGVSWCTSWSIIKNKRNKCSDMTYKVVKYRYTTRLQIGVILWNVILSTVAVALGLDILLKTVG
jgi:hypothetical protein